MVSFVLFSENSQGDQSVKDLNTAPDEDKSWDDQPWVRTSSGMVSLGSEQVLEWSALLEQVLRWSALGLQQVLGWSALGD